MKKTIIIFLTLMILFNTAPIFSDDLARYNISIDNLRSHVEVLNSEDFQGRLIGTDGNKKTIGYINNIFKENGLIPLENDYTYDFEAMNISYLNPLKFNISDMENNIVAKFEEGKDFKISLKDYSYVGSFNGEFKSIDSKDQILRNQYKFEDIIALIDYEDEAIISSNLDSGEIDDRLFYKGAKVIIYPERSDISYKDYNLGSKNIHLNKSGIIKLGVTKEIYNMLKEYEQLGYKADIDIPIVFNSVNTCNIIGKIEGKKKNYNNIVIVAPIDGLGVDINGDILPGGTDNTSSLTLLLELSRILSKDKKVDSNIIFVGLNATKFGTSGFENLFRIEEIDWVNSQVIYLDKIGSKGNKIVAGTLNNSSKFQLNQLSFNKLLDSINDLGIEHSKDENYMSSDYINFRYKGLRAFVLTNGANKNTGTIYDDIENIDFTHVYNIGDIVLNYIYKYGNINTTYQIWIMLKSIWYIAAIGFFIFISFGLLKRKSLRLQRDTFPILSIVLAMTFFISVLIIQTKHGIVLSQGILYQNTSIGFSMVLNTLLESILPFALMFGYLSIFVFPVIVLLSLLKVFMRKKKISDNIFLIIACISSTLSVIWGFSILYNYEYSLIFPELLSLPHLNHILILFIGFYNYIVIYFLKKEKSKIIMFRLLALYILLNLIFVALVYSPYIFNKTIIELRSGNGSLWL